MKAYFAKEEEDVLLKRAARAAVDLYAGLKVSYPGYVLALLSAPYLNLM